MKKTINGIYSTFYVFHINQFYKQVRGKVKHIPFEAWTGP